MNIYDINAAIADAYEKAVDPDTGEIIDADMLAAIDDLNMELGKKLRNLALMYKNSRAFAACVKEEIAAMQKKQKAAENHAEGIRRYLDGCMYASGLNKLRTPNVDISYRKSSKVVVTDEAALRTAGLVHPPAAPEIDLATIGKLLRGGQAVTGAYLAEVNNIQIK